ncbi:hypothetical protein SOVF_040180 [Spinacia oleracea]|nr:hypothetical protein SOVF_040180 [Spinacia oleracea]
MWLELMVDYTLKVAGLNLCWINSLSFGEFMVFKYNGQRTFDILILGRDGCKKESGNAEETEDSEEVVKHVDDDDYGNAEETEESDYQRKNM